MRPSADFLISFGIAHGQYDCSEPLSRVCGYYIAMTFDGIDAKILALLQTNNRLTSEEIGRRIHLSSTAVAKRLKKLRESGLIAAEVAVLDLEAVGPFVGALVLCSFDPDGVITLDQFAMSVLPRPEVINAWVVTGEVDVVLNVLTRTVGEYEQILRELQQEFPQLKSVRTLVTLRQPKRSLVIPFAPFGPASANIA